MELVPKPLLDGIVRVFNPQQVILFGSHARGEAHADSDIDLYVVVDDDIPPELLNWREVGDARRDYDGAVDIIVARRARFERRKTWFSGLARAAAKEGIVIYAR